MYKYAFNPHYEDSCVIYNLSFDYFCIAFYVSCCILFYILVYV